LSRIGVDFLPSDANAGTGKALHDQKGLTTIGAGSMKTRPIRRSREPLISWPTAAVQRHP